MKTKNLTINVGVRKFNAVYQTKEFEAIVKVGRMVNANCIAMEAAHNVLGGKGQDLAGKEVKSIIIMLHKLGREGEMLLSELSRSFYRSESFAAFVRMSDNVQEREGKAPDDKVFIDFKITSPNDRVARAIRKLDLIGTQFFKQKVKDAWMWEISEADFEARETYQFYRDEATRTGNPEIFFDALNKTWTWLFQFNYAAMEFIRGQAKDPGLAFVEEEVLKIRKTATVH